MSGATLTCDLAGGYRLIVTEARIEEGAFIGEAAILDAHDRERYANFVTIDQSGALGFVQFLPEEVQREVSTGELLTALLEWSLDPAATLCPPIVPPAFTLDLAGGETLHARDMRRGEDGHLRAQIGRRDAAGNLRAARLVVFDDGAEEYSARRAFNLDPFSWEILARELQALVATTPGAQPSRIVRAGDIALTEPEWLIAGILPRTGLALLVGKEASYKSFVALSMAGAVLTGLPWLGNDVERGPVLYLAGEGQSGVKRRVRAWEIAHGLSLDELLILPLPVAFLDDGAMRDLEDEVAALDPTPALIVVDTLARYFGGDENATSDMSRFVEACDRLKRRTGAQVVVVHHLSKVGEFRGNTALVAAVDTRIDAKRDGYFVTLACTKQKDWGEFEPVQLASYPVELGLTDRRGVPISSLVLQPADPEQLREAKREAEARMPLSEAQQRTLNVLLVSWPLTASAWQANAETEGVSRTRFYEYVKVLRDRGLIIRSEERHGQYSPTQAALAFVPSPKLVPFESHGTAPRLVPSPAPPLRGAGLGLGTNPTGRVGSDD